MQITVLLENTTTRKDMKIAHGLSLYLQAAGHSFLFDFGPGAQFAENAPFLGVDLNTVEFGILSHGHYDHGGGLDLFLRRFPGRPVYLQPGAFAHHYSGARDIGLTPSLQDQEALREVGPDEIIASGLRLLARPAGTAFIAPDNALLFEEDGPDRFDHEQCLLIEEAGKLVLVGGCAHRGIYNQLELARQAAGRWPDAVVSGFHLATPGGQPDEQTIQDLARQLAQLPTQYYTCHCTGLPGWERLHALLGDQVHYLATGDTLKL